MSLYFEKARELGELIRTSQQSMILNEANGALMKNPESLRKMEEYKKQQNNINTSMENASMTQEQLQKAGMRLADIAADLKRDPLINSLIYAETEFNALVNQVMNVLYMTISGEDAENSFICAGRCERNGRRH